MSESTPEVLHLTAAQKFYLKTALGMLAEGYDGESQPQHASNCRMLATRIDAYQATRTQPTPKDAERWQQRVMDTQGDPVQFQAAIREWIHELAEKSADPAAALAEALLPMLDHTSTARQTALQVLTSVEQKIMALIRDPHVSGPDDLFKNLIGFIHTGQARITQGQPPWEDDPHLRALAEEMAAQQRQAAQATPQ